MKINLVKIGMPDDVIINSGDTEITLNGKLSGDPNEIIVITQFRREVFSGTVCHISNGYTKRNGGDPCKVILDMPGFKKIIIPDDDTHYVKKIGGVKYTMACLAEKDDDNSLANWLY